MPGFVDQAQLHARAGDGGAGAVSWRREAHVDRGGPDGGDGGHGGDVWLVASVNESSLLGFRDHPFRRATDGVHGSGSKKHGARGKDLVVPVPVGTVVRDRRRRRGLRPRPEGARFMVAEGGQGGRGNARFLSNRRRAPAFAEQAEKGQEFWLDMELKLMADVALVGFPNAGKSTLISTVSAAKPKIADYPFTTLEPHLGVVRVGGVRDGTEFVMADIPGLVEGAAEGKGLGHQFLRHIERARVLVVLLDLGAPAAGGVSPSEQLRILLSELGSYRPELLDRPRMVVGSKADVGVRRRGRVRHGALGGVRMRASARCVERPCRRWSRRCGRRRPRRPRARSSCTGPSPRAWPCSGRGRARGWSQGRAAERAVALSDLNDEGAQAEVVRRLRRLGVDRALARAGARDGDEITVGSHDLHLGGRAVIAVVKVGSSSVTDRDGGAGCAGSWPRRAPPGTPWWWSPPGPSRPAGTRSTAGSNGRRTPPSLQAVSAVGQHRLMRLWQDGFEPLRRCWPARCCWRRSTSSTARSTCTRGGRCGTWPTSASSRSSTRTTPWPTRRSASATTTGWPRWWRTWSARSSSSC